MNEATNEAAAVSTPDNSDIPSAFHSVVAEHGRDMFALCMNTGLATEAASILAALVQKHHSSHGVEAITRLVTCYNQTASAYALAKGWTQEQVKNCDRDIQLAFSKTIITPGSRILLDS